MTMKKSEMLSRLAGAHQTESLDRLRSFLASDETQPVAEEPSRVSAAEALKLWETRLRITALTKRPIYGAGSLVDTIRDIDPGSELEQYGFLGPDMAGNIFFEARGGGFVGLVLADRTTANPPH